MAIQNETDRRLIIGIDSDTDHLPVGAVRDVWAVDALIEKEIQIAVPKQTVSIPGVNRQPASIR